MKKWQIKEDENIADILVEVYGKDMKEFFSNLLQAFSNIIVDLKKITLNQKKRINIKAKNFSELVFNFIEKLIFLKDVNGLIFKKGKFEFKKNDYYILKATLKGEKIKNILPIKIDIKAVALHKFEVKKNKFYKARIVFDI